MADKTRVTDAKIRDFLLQHFCPAVIGVNRSHTVVFSSGPAERFVSFPVGVPSWNILEMVPEEVRSRLDQSLQRIHDGGKPETFGAAVTSRKVTRVFTVSVRKIPHEKDMVAVAFSEGSGEVAGQIAGQNATAADVLDDELKETRRKLNKRVQELQNYSEELGTANEELRVSNEELETSREELQSLNEELDTANEQLRIKNRDLEHTTQDLNNFMSSTGVPALFLDGDLTIRRYTQQAHRLVRLRESDIGRDVAELSSRILGPGLIEDARKVLSDAHPRQCEIVIGPSRYIRWVRPYRRLDRSVTGVVLTFIDITDLKQTQDELTRSEQRYRIMGETVPYGVWAADAHGQTTYISQLWCEMVGRSQEEVLETGWLDSIISEQRDEGVEKWYHSVKTGDPFEHEHRVRAHDGSVRVVLARGLPVRDTDGNITGWAGINLDITERKRIQDQLLMTLESFGDGFFAVDGDWKFVYLNAEAERVLDLKRGEVIGQSLWEVFPLAVGTKLQEEFRRVAAGEPRNFENYYKPWGRWFQNRCFPREGGGLVVYFEDITEKKHAREELKRSEELYRTLIDKLPGGAAFIVDRDYRYVLAQGEALAAAGFRPEDFKGKTIEEALDPETAVWHRKLYEKGFSGESFRHEHENHGRYYISEGAPLRDREGRVAQVLAISYDITERKESEDALRESRIQLLRRTEELTEANRELEAFSYSVSHDLRAPVRYMRGFSDILLEDYADKLDEEGMGHLRRIVAGGEKINSLIDDMITLSRISRQEMAVSEIDLSRMACEIVKELREQDPEREIEIKIQPDLYTTGDDRLLNIALTNLLGNAWKYTGKTDHPRIELGTTQKNSRKVFFVRDNGAGFPMKQSHKLFQPFQRLHRENDFAGTGIGLPIVQRVIKRHGGRVWAESEVGEGSVFYFTLGGSVKA